MIKVRFAEFLVFLQVSLFTPHLLFFRSNLNLFSLQLPPATTAPRFFLQLTAKIHTSLLLSTSYSHFNFYLSLFVSLNLYT